MVILRTLWCVSLFLIHTMLFAQHENFENLSIDRPDVSNLPTTIQPGHYQIEVGLEFAENDFVREFNLPTFLLRTGLNKKSELRVGVSHYQLDSSESLSPKTSFVNTISFKYRFVEENGIIPSIAIQPDINFGFTEGQQKNPEVDYAFILLFNNSLHEKIFINYNAGILIKKEANEFLLSASLSFLHTHRLGYFIEVYNLSEQIGLNYLSVDGGITFLVKPRF